jgi:hypothetical protein
MERALHPDLAKRIVHTDPRSGRSRLDLHVAKFNGRWVIVNVLWELKPQQK